MQAIVWQDRQLKFRDDYPEPVPEPGEALVRVLLAGICNTDLEISRGYLDFNGVPGHEFVGEVISAPNPALTGQRVVGEINCSCGACSYCRAGLGRHCPQRAVLGIVNKDGAFAQYLTLPEENLHIVPPGLTNREAVFCEPLAAAREILEQVDISSQHEVLVMGDGKLGIMIAQVLKTTDCKLSVVGKHTQNLDIFESLGIQAGPLNQLGKQQFDIVVDATGSPQGLALAMGHTRPRGILILKTTIADDQLINLAPLVINELTVIGSRCGPFTPALNSLAEGRIKVDSLISGVYPLSRGVEALQKAAHPGTLKVLIRIKD